MATNKSIVLISSKVRKERNREMYRVTLEYVTTKGIKRFVSVLKQSKAEAKAHLQFRLNGLNNGAPVVDR